MTLDIETLKKFFGTLGWDVLEPRIREALENPEKSIPIQIYCPAVDHLATMVVREMGDDAVKAFGQPPSPEAVKKANQMVAILRMLEVLVSLAEEACSSPLLEQGGQPCELVGPSSKSIQGVPSGIPGPTGRKMIQLPTPGPPQRPLYPH